MKTVNVKLLKRVYVKDINSLKEARWNRWSVATANGTTSTTEFVAMIKVNGVVIF